MRQIRSTKNVKGNQMWEGGEAAARWMLVSVKGGITLAAVEDWGDGRRGKVLPVGFCGGCTRSIVPGNLIHDKLNVRFPILRVSQGPRLRKTNTKTWTVGQAEKGKSTRSGVFDSGVVERPESSDAVAW